jgi:hypothetical protein
MRVLYLNYEWDLRESSGASTHMRELTAGLRSLGHTVLVRDRHHAPGDSGRTAPPQGARGAGLALRRRLVPYLHAGGVDYRLENDNQWNALGHHAVVDILRQRLCDTVLRDRCRGQGSPLARTGDRPAQATA